MLSVADSDEREENKRESLSSIKVKYVALP